MECTQTHNNGTVSLTFTETQNTRYKEQAKPKIVRTPLYVCKRNEHNGSSNNLPCYPPDRHQCDNAVYWRTIDSIITLMRN